MPIIATDKGLMKIFFQLHKYLLFIYFILYEQFVQIEENDNFPSLMVL